VEVALGANIVVGTYAEDTERSPMDGRDYGVVLCIPLQPSLENVN
jgi:hypothetical protein